jgi:hypothetical protein
MIHSYPLQMYFKPDKACPSCGFDEEGLPYKRQSSKTVSLENQHF